MGEAEQYVWQIHHLADTVIDAHRSGDDALLTTLYDTDLRKFHIVQDVLTVVLSRLLPESE